MNEEEEEEEMMNVEIRDSIYNNTYMLLLTIQ
jgi:hypothetical protein